MENGSARYPYPVQISEKKMNTASVSEPRDPLGLNHHVTDSDKHDTESNYYILDISECDIP